MSDQIKTASELRAEMALGRSDADRLSDIYALFTKEWAPADPAMARDFLGSLGVLMSATSRSAQAPWVAWAIRDAHILPRTPVVYVVDMDQSGTFAPVSPASRRS
jgi:hypothetical protein